MKTRSAVLLVGLLGLSSGCHDFLDVNTNPNGPQSVAANLYLPPMLYWFATSPQYDGRFVGRYAQEWTLPGTSLSTWDRMGYDAASDNGARKRWLKLAWGMKALVLNHFSNTISSYTPDAVMAAVDSSFASNDDDALMSYPSTSTDFLDYNFWGRSRNNITNYRQTQFVLGLMNGTQFGGVVDPRMTRMLSPSPDGQYRGLNPNVVGFGALDSTTRPNNFFGYVGTGGARRPRPGFFSRQGRGSPPNPPAAA